MLNGGGSGATALRGSRPHNGPPRKITSIRRYPTLLCVSLYGDGRLLGATVLMAALIMVGDPFLAAHADGVHLHFLASAVAERGIILLHMPRARTIPVGTLEFGLGGPHGKTFCN